MSYNSQSKALDSSWNLEAYIAELPDSELKTLAMRYIKLSHDDSTGQQHSIANLTYRGNLHYILDHKERILQELKDFVAKLENK